MPTTTRASAARSRFPVYVDADTGFGGVNNVRQMVRAFEDAGVAGLFLSDQVFPNRCGYLPGKQIIPVEQMLAKVKAALDARRDRDLFIAARTDAAGVTSVEDAIARCQLFMEAGADMAKPMGLDTIPDIKRALREIPGPHMATLSQAAGPKARSLQDLEAAGVVAATFPSVRAVRGGERGAQRAAAAQAQEFAGALPGRTCSRSTTTTTSSASSRCSRARRPTTRPPPRWCRSARRSDAQRSTIRRRPRAAGTHDPAQFDQFSARRIAWHCDGSTPSRGEGQRADCKSATAPPWRRPP